MRVFLFAAVGIFVFLIVTIFTGHFSWGLLYLLAFPFALCVNIYKVWRDGRK